VPIILSLSAQKSELEMDPQLVKSEIIYTHVYVQMELREHGGGIIKIKYFWMFRVDFILKRCACIIIDFESLTTACLKRN
jgi:hypothetical protein